MDYITRCVYIVNIKPSFSNTVLPIISLCTLTSDIKTLLTSSLYLFQEPDSVNDSQDSSHSDINHSSPQHRQYLSNEGYGFGTPYQR